MRLLLLDTCGDVGSLALAADGEVLRERTLAPRTASAQLVGAIREEMETVRWPLRTLAAVGVVNGPGSFTGVRVGLAAAKGLCEVAGLRLVTVSRLGVLLAAGAASAGDVAALDAGRGEFYVRAAGAGDEELMTGEELAERSAPGRVLVTEAKLLELLQGLHPVRIELAAASALGLVEARLQRGNGESVEAADASYVRHARGLYPSRPKTTTEQRQP